MACHHRLLAAQTVERRQAWHAIIALGRQTRSNDVRRDMPSPPLDSTHGRTSSGVACHHCLWAAHTVERRREWHAIIAFGQHTHGRTTSGVACHHRLWTTHTVGNVGRGMTLLPLDYTHGGQRRAWHDITALGQHTRSATSGVAWHHRPWTEHTVGYVGRGMPSPPLDYTHGWQCRAWHDITALGQHTRSSTSGVA